MAAPPTNQHVVELLDRVLREIVELRAEQAALRAELGAIARDRRP